MKHIVIPLFTFTFGLHLASAAMPLTWTVETTRAQPATFEAYQGETLAFEAALMSRGKPLEAPSNYSLFWQTNGMGSTYWESPCPTNYQLPATNLLRATWLPSMDVGARVYNCFIGAPSNIYHAAFQLRLRPSPGATPNVLPLPVPVIDFAKVRVLNPPWESGGGGSFNTNAVRDIIHATVDGAARPLPKYLHIYDADDSYPDAAAEYYRQRQGGGAVPAPQCSAVRSGGYLSRNFDFPFDERSEFVVKMSAGKNRFASVGVAQVGTNLTEQIVTSGKPEYSHLYKWLPGATVDGINENGVVAEINVVDTPVAGWHTNATDKAIHPLAAVRWVLDNATNAQSAAQYIAANIRFPVGWTQNFHYMIADTEKTYIVENGMATDGDEYHEPDEPVTMTNFQLSKFPWGGMGMERFGLLLGGASITNAWYTRAYHRSTNPPWVSDLADVLDYTNAIFDAWAAHPKEYFRNQLNGGQPWWQSVHTSIYDITNRVLRVAVQEQNDWYTFSVPSAGTDEAAVRKIAQEEIAKIPPFEETDPTAAAKANAAIAAAGCVTLGEGGGITNEYLFGTQQINTYNVPGSEHYGESSQNDFALRHQIEAATNGIPEMIGSVEFTANAALDSADAAQRTANDALFLANNASAAADDAQAHSEATRAMIDATNPTFSNAVVTIARELTPKPSPTLRLFDEVRQCYWIGKMVNGVMQWEVE